MQQIDNQLINLAKKYVFIGGQFFLKITLIHRNICDNFSQTLLRMYQRSLFCKFELTKHRKVQLIISQNVTLEE